MKGLLKKSLSQSAIFTSEEKLDALVEFFAMLKSTNEHTNLTRIVSDEDAVEKHFRDSLEGVRFISDNICLLDVGSGGGFPAIPLSIVRDDISVTMIDSTGKKVDFLNNVCNTLSLNAHALHVRAEDYAMTDDRESFDVVTARAVASLPTLLEYCLPFVKVGGLFIAYKTDVAEIDMAKKALSVLGGKIEKIHPYTIGGGDNRALFIIKKVTPTPPKYPRGQGKPKQKPIQ